jgi:hypothetical protein
MDIILGLFGAFIGLAVCVALFMVALPIYGSAGLFINRPGGKVRSGFHFFTKLEPGQVKAIVRGDKLVRMITNTAGKRFVRKSKNPATEYDSAEYWELEDGKTENPVADVWEPIRGWAQLVYDKTGLVFTGIYPFQRVREYTLERTKVNRSEVGREQATSKSNLVLEVDTDISDHYRTREFLFPMHITGAETKDKIPLDIIGVAEMEVVNAYKAAFGTDRWDQKVINLVTDAINATTKTLPLDMALTADAGRGLAIQQAATNIEEDMEVCGIEIKGFKILEINPVLDKEGLAAIQAEAIALQKAKATRVDGKARADALRDLNEANVAGGEHSVATMEAEAFVRAAEAIGKSGGSAILMPGGGRQTADPTQVAILAELKKLNQGRR